MGNKPSWVSLSLSLSPCLSPARSKCPKDNAVGCINKHAKRWLRRHRSECDSSQVKASSVPTKTLASAPLTLQPRSAARASRGPRCFLPAAGDSQCMAAAPLFWTPTTTAEDQARGSPLAAHAMEADAVHAVELARPHLRQCRKGAKPRR